MQAQYSIASCRIDGSVAARDRQKIIDMFNAESDSDDTDDDDGRDDDYDSDSGGRPKRPLLRPSVCLLTTKACG
jgi:hypothetical protein